MISVVGIVEENKKIRDLIQRYLNLQNELSCPVAVESMQEMLKFLEEHPNPDVILVGIELQDIAGIKRINLIKNRCSEIDIIMLTVYHNSHSIFNALRAGASGYLLKHTPLPEMKKFIIGLLEDGASMSPKIARKVIHYFQANGSVRNSRSNLTPREYDIAKGLVNGLSYKMIAERYEIPLSTIRVHIRDIYKKLHGNAAEE